MLRFGHVLTRWINRPMVPFPEELKPAEKDYYSAYLLQLGVRNRRRIWSMCKAC